MYQPQMNGHQSYQMCLESTSNKIALILVFLFPGLRQVVSGSWRGELTGTMKQFFMELAPAQVLAPLHIFLELFKISITFYCV